MTSSTVSQAQLRAVRRSQKLLGNGLARLYSAVTAEPVPEDFLLLLEGVERKPESGSGAR